MDEKQKKPRSSAQAEGRTTRRSGSSDSRPARKTAKSGQQTSQTARPDRRAAQSAKPAQRRRTRRETAPKRPVRRRTPKTQPDAQVPRVVYTPAAPFSRGRLVLQLATVVAVVLALTFGVSIFFRVEKVMVQGAVKYTPAEIQEASGIREGDGLMTFGRTVACGKIKSLPYVDTVRIGIKLPDTVNIVIKEFDVLYAIKDDVGNWWLMTATGKLIDQVDSARAGEYTEIEGVRIRLPLTDPKSNPGRDVFAEAMETSPPTPASGETDPVTVLAADRLNTVLSIAQYLEQYGVLGEMASIDVSDLGRIEMVYGQRFTVKLGDTSRLDYKLRCMKTAIDQMEVYESGELDISFTIRPDEIIYTPIA